MFRPIPTRLARRVRGWPVPLLLFGAYLTSPRLADRFGGAIDPRAVARVEYRIFGRLPSASIQWRLSGHRKKPLEAAVTVVYSSHYIVPFLTGAVLLTDRRRFAAWRRRLVVLGAIGIAGYVTLPTEPPWMVGEDVDGRPIERTVSRGFRVMRISFLADLLERGQRSVNPVAAMPSLHAAVPVLLAAFGRDLGSRTLVVGATAYSAAMGATLVVAGEHHVLDLVAGWFVAGLTAATAAAFEHRRGIYLGDG